MAQKPEFDYDLIVIGSGAGGSPAATIAAKNNKRVAIIEQSTFGGESPNWGEIPQQTMLNVINILNQSKQSATFGLRTNSMSYNFPSMIAWRNLVIKRTGVANNKKHYEKQNIDAFSGVAHFLSPNEISVNRRHLSAKKFLIASGSEWAIPTIPGIDKLQYFTPKTILAMTRPPKSLFILGNNKTALEIAAILSILGTKIYIAYPESDILDNYDQEVTDLITTHLSKQQGVTFLPKTKVVAMQKDGLYNRVTYIKSSVEQSVKVDEILIAAHRIPVTDIGLENAGVKYNSSGIIVNRFLQTSARHIFASGSCVDVNLKTHDIITQSRLAASNILRRQFTKLKKSPRLEVIYTYPEIATVGLSEKACKEQKIAIKTAISPLTMVARSNITDQRTGFVKLIVNKKGVLIGGAIVAPQASEMIHELNLAISHKMTADDLFNTPHYFTAWAEAIRITAGKLL